MSRLSIVPLALFVGFLAVRAAAPPRPDPAADLKFASLEESKAEFEKSAAKFLAKHCVACHGPKKAEGDLDLTALAPI